MQKEGSFMECLRKTICLLSALFLSLSVPALPVCAAQVQTEKAASEYTWITDREAVDGGDYTENAGLAEALNAIFDGNAGVYYDYGCTKPVNTELGSSRVPNNGVNKYVGPYAAEAENIGTSCWIYANGVYHTLFGETTGNGTAGENSQKLDLSTTANRNFSYENFQAWGVRPGVGALIRTRCGHSLIVLGYDQEKITILDGNGNGKGLVSIRVMSWERQGFRAKYIIQPNQEHMDALYPENGAAASNEDTQAVRTAADRLFASIAQKTFSSGK